MKKVLKIFSVIVICWFVLSTFGWMVHHVSKGDKKFGFLTEPVRFMYTFLDLFSMSVEEVQALPDTFVETPANFQSVNKLDSNLIVLTTFSDVNDSRSVELMNLKNDSVLYKWSIDNPYKEHDRILNPLLLPNKNLIFSYDGKALMRIDSLSNVVWKQDSVWAHHAINFDSDNNVWACTFPTVYYATGLYHLNDSSIFYKDNYISKVDSKTGRILFYKSITDIFKENGLSSYLLKSGHIWDPIHLNDVEPALATTRYFNKGDVFISMRHPSLILQYRPSENKVLKVIEGPFVGQHDVDILNDSTLVFFNNNYYPMEEKNNFRPAPPDSSTLAFAGNLYSNILQYNYGDNSFTIVGDSLFSANHIFTKSEGLIDFVDAETVFVEEQNSSVLWLIKNKQVIYKNVLKSPHKGYHHLTNWIRIIKSYE